MCASADLYRPYLQLYSNGLFVDTFHISIVFDLAVLVQSMDVM